MTPPAADERALAILITCEHGGNDVPEAYRGLFVGHEALLRTHRGFDPGALELARELADALDAPLVASTTTRLLIDLNRSLGHAGMFSELTRDAPPGMRDGLVETFYRPYRARAEQVIDAAIAEGRRVFHLSSHSFTPELDGEIRNADIGLLYDPRRARELTLASRWHEALRRRAPDLRVRRNYPYTGRADGFCAGLRKRLDGDDYVGLELEVNQRHVLQGGPAWTALRERVLASLKDALGEMR